MLLQLLLLLILAAMLLVSMVVLLVSVVVLLVSVAVLLLADAVEADWADAWLAEFVDCFLAADAKTVVDAMQLHLADAKLHLLHLADATKVSYLTF